MFNAFSFCLIKKKQKIKAARILLKSVSVELKGLKLAALRQQPLLNVHTPRFLNVKFMRPVLLGSGASCGCGVYSRCFARLLGWARLRHHLVQLASLAFHFVTVLVTQLRYRYLASFGFYVRLAAPLLFSRQHWETFPDNNGRFYLLLLENAVFLYLC